ncbi:MAG: substrate-binding domain-containing protein [Defluviitaleaceae bacterium]|nr:substrate-binding domain-containing protein [Defluviitaleaceae bacterium]
MKKFALLAVLLIAGIITFTGCGADNNAAPAAGTNQPAAAATPTPAPAAGTTEAAPAGTTEAAPASNFNDTREIVVVSREEGSGTRGAFIEILGVLVTGADGSSRDMTTLDAEIAPGTSVVIGSVGGNPYAIGYISLGSLNDTVTAISVDGVAPTAANVQNGTYPLFRTFYLAVLEDRDPATQEFLDFVLSAEGQAIVEDRNYVKALATAPSFEPSGEFSGTVVVSGSTSVEPLMLRMKEAFEAIHTNVTVEVHAGGTSAGINAAISGTADIGMSSRDIRPSEIEQGIVPIAIAYDGLAVIINNDNPTNNMDSETIRQIFVGDVTRWNAVN